MIPEKILDVERKLTANEISVYNIYAGPGGSWVREWYESNLIDYGGYKFYLRRVIADEDGFYYLTIRKKDQIVRKNDNILIENYQAGNATNTP